MTAVLTPTELAAAIGPADVRDVLARSILADGLDFVLDIDRSSGSYLVDARTGRRYLDMFTFVASSALGMNHPALADDEEFRAELLQAAVEGIPPRAPPARGEKPRQSRCALGAHGPLRGDLHPGPGRPGATASVLR